MSLVVTPAYTWADGDLVTATRLTSTGTPTIADGQAGVFSTVSTTGTISSTIAGNSIVLSAGTATTGYRYMSVGNTGGALAIGVESSVSGNLIAGDTAYDGVIAHASGLSFSSTGGASQQMRLSSTGLAVTGGLSATTGINSTTIGAVTPATGAFTTLSATGFASNGGNKYQTADLLTSSGTGADLTGLTLALVSGNTYTIRGVIFASSGVSTSANVIIHGSGGLVASYTVNSITAMATNGTTTTPDTSVSFAMEASKGQNPSAGLTVVFYIECTITVGTSGTFSIQGSRSGPNSATFYKGSFIRATPY